MARLEIFGSGARGDDFDPARSDADFLVEFAPGGTPSALDQFFGLAEALEALLGRPVDLAERGAIEASRNFIRRRRILSEAQPVYGRRQNQPAASIRAMSARSRPLTRSLRVAPRASACAAR